MGLGDDETAERVDTRFSETEVVELVASEKRRRLLDDQAHAGGFAEFYGDDFRKLTGFVIMLGASPQDAADIVQKAMIALLEKWGSVDHPGAWVRTVATRMHLKTAPVSIHEVVTEVVPDRPSALYSPADLVEISEASTRIVALLDELPEQQRMVMAWRLDGYDDTEIARGLGTTRVAVRRAAARARKTLTQTMEARRCLEEGR